MEWPSKNVSKGGVLHPAKTTYSPETKQFIKLLMEESKMTMMQRKKLDYFLRNGEPFPLPGSDSTRRKSKLPEVTIRPGSTKRRSIKTILDSGAYERDKFIPNQPIVDRDREKEKLANKMAYNKDIEVSKPKLIEKIAKTENVMELNRFDQLIQEIKEREEWLKEMESLGEAKKYKLIIEQQIQEKMREMEKLKIESL